MKNKGDHRPRNSAQNQRVVELLRCPETLFIFHKTQIFFFQSLEWFRVRQKHQK